MTCVVLNRLEVRNANAQPAWWIIGPPSPVAYCGFAHALSLAVDAKSSLQGVIPMHHHYELLQNFNSPHQHRGATFIDHNDHVGASGKKYGPLSSQPTARCSLTITLVIQFEPGTKINPNDLNSFLSRTRIAGGDVFDVKRPLIVESIDEIKPSGFGIHERMDLIRNDPLELIDACHPRNEDSWLMPTTVGYQAITPPTIKPLARNNFLHAFSEPLVAPVQYKTARTALPPLWRYKAVSDHTFLVTTED